VAYRTIAAISFPVVLNTTVAECSANSDANISTAHLEWWHIKKQTNKQTKNKIKIANLCPIP